jgi:hypothetical protein
MAARGIRARAKRLLGVGSWSAIDLRRAEITLEMRDCRDALDTTALRSLVEEARVLAGLAAAEAHQRDVDSDRMLAGELARIDRRDGDEDDPVPPRRGEDAH